MNRKAEIRARYVEAARRSEEFRQNRWGTVESWEGRFRTLLPLVELKTGRWLDVGCGTGRFFEVAAAKHGLASVQCVGVDLTEPQLKIARGKDWSGVERAPEFRCADLATVVDAESGCDLVTCVGVIYCCGMDPAGAVSILARCVGGGGRLVITSENPLFSGFQADSLNQYPSAEDLLRHIERAADWSSLETWFFNPREERMESAPVADPARYKEFVCVAVAG